MFLFQAIYFQPFVLLEFIISKIVSGQHQDVSGNHQTHLGRAIGQSGKKEADSTFELSAIRTHC
jgi:hypothetical protein